MEVFFARHGESEANLYGLYAGQTDFPLTPKGELQAVELGKKLSPAKPFDLVIVSDLSRTKRTAELIAHDCKKVVVTPFLRERCWGKIEGHAPQEFGYPKGFEDEDYAVDSERVAACDIEPLEKVLKRARKVISLFKGKKFNRVLLVSSEIINSYIISELLGETKETRIVKLQPNDSINLVIIGRGKPELFLGWTAFK